MILNAKFKKPALSFGLGRTALTIPLGASATAYLQGTYRADNYEIRINGVRVFDNKRTFTPSAVGEVNIKALIYVNNDRTQTIESNTIILTVTE